ncbi:hypothetical protein FACS1894121_1560 [Bacteroidia bacterium]|nr:hypothetical protein FACS1894121_1560 [Bacteroidia bacterium]
MILFMTPKKTEEELLTVKEAAELLKVTEVTVKRYIAKDVIPSVKIGGARRIIKGDVWDDFVQKMRTEKYGKLDDEVADYFVSDPQTEYYATRELAKEERKSKLGFNGLTPTEWALLSKNGSKMVSPSAEYIFINRSQSLIG